MKHISEKAKLTAIIASAVLALAVVTFIAVTKFATPVPETSNGTEVKHPYAMLVDGKEVLLVKSRKDGINALGYLTKLYTPEGTETRTVTYDKKITFVEKEIKPFQKLGTVLSEEEAAKTLLEKNMEDTPVFTATVIAQKYKNRDIEPKIRFKYDDSMGLFDYEVVQEGVEGVKRTRYEWLTENGKIVSKEKKETKVTIEPVNAIVKTGYEETPKDLKWDDYGDFQKAVQTDEADSIVGGEMVKYGKSHLGAPYKVGGKSYKTGIDCVQFVRDIYRKFGIELPGKRSALAHVGKGVSLKNAKPGDIVYYGNHVAMYIGHGKIIHATYKGISIRNVNYRKWSTIRHIKKKKKK